MRAPRPRTSPDRLLVAPVFIHSSVRSGSTLLRVLLNSHSRLHAPHELHLRSLKVQEENKYVAKSMRALGLDQRELEHLLWDRILHREMEKSGKDILVNKTPGNAFMWKRIARCWPDARFIFLLRHPVSTVASWQSAHPKWGKADAIADTMRYMKAVEEARQGLPGLTVRYEELTADPREVTQRICAFLEVDWEAGMLDYGKHTHGSFKAGLGDWTDKIRTGTVQPARPLPDHDEVPAELRDLCVAWGYHKETSDIV
ncbi:MAG: sulfotransferase family protein [Streptomycetales bacterium]